ncbi:predicted protein [Naegleria gruberi]|uniref:Predicted protein n=1 Tax=Naegleria gruberi TaxID=5762 RepID=D2V6X0_NAEGR|nr:uncharacterized protein NAEGRDRAFT_64585 [Naegleria gruberi]EFC47519.1 predicted protein [Naegleria gruberi]|eukprot:XP_002680263.1 predicted protein [Naegleria gruberi strain NEG-M]
MVEKFIREKSNTELNLQEAQQEKLLRKIDEEIAPQFSRIFLCNNGGKKVSSPSSPSSPTSSKSSKSTESYESFSNQSVESIIEQELQSYLNIVDPDVLFNEIVISVNVDLKLDQFPRFSRSKFLLDFLNKQGEAFTRSIAIDVSRGFHVDIRFLPKDLSKNFIYDKDIFFGFSLIEDSPDWQVIPCSAMSNQAQLYHSNTSYIFGNNATGMKLYKMVTILPYKLEDVFSAFCFIQGEDTGDRLTENRIIGSNAPKQAMSMTGVDEKTNPLAIRYVTSSLKLLLPGLKEREFPRSLTCVYDCGLDAYINVGHTSRYSFHDVSKERVEMDMFFVNIMYRIGDSTRFVYVIYSDAHTPKVLDSMFAKAHWKQRCVRLEQTFFQLLQTHQTSELSDNFKLKELVEENLKAHPQKSWYRDYLSLFHNKSL